MPFAWAVGRAVNRFARACGASPGTAGVLSGISGVLLLPVDPVGSCLNFAHVGAGVAAEKGSLVGKVANIGLSAIVLTDAVTALPSLMSGTSVSDIASAAASSSMDSSPKCA